MLVQLLQIIGNRCQQHRFLGTGFAVGTQASQTVVVNQITEHGFGRAVALAAHHVTLAALLAGPDPAVSGIIRRAGQLLAPRRGHAARLQRAVMAVLVGGPVDLQPAAVSTSVVLLKRQGLARAQVLSIRC